MGKRSRLRAQHFRWRRLITMVLVISGVLVGLTWYGGENGPGIVKTLRALLRGGERSLLGGREAPRGTIYDRNYKEIAVSYERVSVYANIREIDELGRIVIPLSVVLNTTPTELYDSLGAGSLRAWLAKDISQEQEEDIRSLDLPGIYLHKEYVRHYPHHKTAAHLVGFVEKDTGLAGMEHYLNRLESKHRSDKVEGENLPRIGAGRPGVDGRHLILTLDLKIQQILDNYLSSLPAADTDIKVGALVMEAGSGALIGYSQVPSYDPNSFNTYPEEVFRDVFMETIAVPEVFKVFLRDISLLQGEAEQGEKLVPWSIAAEKRKLGVQLQLWEKIGAGGHAEYDFFNAPRKVPIRFAGDESPGMPRNFETVPPLQTPLQLLTALTRILNGGVDVAPHVGDRYVMRRNQDEFLLEDVEPRLRGGLLADGVVNEAQALFRAQAVAGPVESGVMEGASASYQKKSGEVMSFRRHYVSLTCIPVSDPELMVLAVASVPGYQVRKNEEVFSAVDTNELVAPVVALQRVMKNLADMMRPRRSDDVNFRGEEDARELGLAALTREAPLPLTEMPDLTGMSLRKSLRLLQHAGVEVIVRGSGRVVTQKPQFGQPLHTGTTVSLQLERDLVEADFKHNIVAKQQ